MSDVKTTVEKTTIIECGKCVIRKLPGGEVQIWVIDIRYWFEPSKIATAQISALEDLRDALNVLLGSTP